MKLDAKAVSVLFLFVIGALLVGCGSPSPVTVESAEELVGRWESECPDCTYTGRFQYFFEDGTYQLQPDREAFERRVELAPPAGEFWFEGGRLYDRAGEYRGGWAYYDCQSTGIYEIELLDEGEIVFTVVEDDCEERKGWFVGVDPEPIVWKKVE